MFQGTQDARDHGWSIRSVFVADPDGPRRVEQTIRLLLPVRPPTASTATSRVRASAAAVNGNRTTIPESKTTSTNGSAPIRTGTNDDRDEDDSSRGGALGSRARIRR